MGVDQFTVYSIFGSLADEVELHTFNDEIDSPNFYVVTNHTNLNDEPISTTISLSGIEGTLALNRESIFIQRCRVSRDCFREQLIKGGYIDPRIEEGIPQHIWKTMFDTPPIQRRIPDTEWTYIQQPVEVGIAGLAQAQYGQQGYAQYIPQQGYTQYTNLGATPPLQNYQTVTTTVTDAQAVGQSILNNSGIYNYNTMTFAGDNVIGNNTVNYHDFNITESRNMQWTGSMRISNLELHSVLSSTDNIGTTGDRENHLITVNSGTVPGQGDST